MTSINMIPIPNPEVVGRVIDNEAVLVIPGKGKVKVLNEAGARIWALVDGSRSVKDIAGQIVSEYKVSQTQAEKDTLEFIQQLLAKDIVRRGG